MNFTARSRSKRLSLLRLRAASMRDAATHSESLLWRELCSSKLGTAFKRQAVLGERYVVDFLAPREKLVVEVDGAYHQLREQADARRDRALERLGYRVLRLEAEVVERDMAVAVARIRGAIEGGRGG